VRRIWVYAVGAAALVAGGTFLFLWAQHFFAPVPLKRFEESRLLHQVVNLRSYAERESLAGFLPPGDAVVSLREDFVQRALDLSLPIRQEFQNGQYEAVLDSAVLRMEDGSASVQLMGRGRRRGDENPDLQVALTVQGYLSAEGARPEAGTLDLGLVVTDVRSVSAGPPVVRDWIRPASHYFASLRAEDWNKSRYRIEIPVRVDQSIELPAIRGEVHIPGGHVPVAVRTSAVTVYERHFAVSFEFAPRGPGQDSIPVDSVFHGESAWTRQLEATVRQAGRHDVRVSRDLLLAERERLFRRVHDLAQRDTLWRALRESDRDVCAVVPDRYLERLAQQFVSTYLRETDLDLEGDIQAKIDQRIKARVLGKEVGAGRISGSIRVLKLTGRLQPAGPLAIDLESPDRLVCSVPVQAVSGRGRIACDIDWDPAFLTGIVCKGFQYRDTLDGVALPFRAALRGVVHLALADSFLVGKTTVRRDRIRVPAAPTQASRDRVLRALEEQDRFGRCGIAMDADTTLQQILQLLKKGVAVRLPARIFPAFRIPVTMLSEYGAGDFRVRARAYDPEFLVRPTYLRLGFQAGLQVIRNEKTPRQAGAPFSPSSSRARALTSGACCSDPAPLRRAPLRSWARTTPGSGPSARSRDPSSSTPGASGARGRPAGRAVHPA
jgi:hypothetical protein